jgi:hypothetical protein
MHAYKFAVRARAPPPRRRRGAAAPRRRRRRRRARRRPAAPPCADEASELGVRGTVRVRVCVRLPSAAIAAAA